MQIFFIVSVSVSFVLLVLCSVKLFRAKSGKDDKFNSFSDDVCSKLNGISKDVISASARLDEINKNSVFLFQTVDKRLEEIRSDNEKRLEEMRKTVDEKLQQTLENRLSTTFKTVSDQLELVYRQLGEMKHLAQDVGNLEKVLTNVKTRGMWGELQAERILQEILLPEQYLKNIPTKHNSHDPVEFAIRLPGSDTTGSVLLPIDSKFPREDYERLCDATQNGDFETAKAMRAALERRIREEAKTISEKYIDVPYTTDFAVLFLPIEGLYAEVLAVAGLQERLQHDFHVMIAGPATLASLLNSLQMGFRTLAIEKKSAEVWNVLGQVKTEFGKFEVTLGRVQDKLQSASKEVENAFVRQRAMGRKLRSVEAVEMIPDGENNLIEDSDGSDMQDPEECQYP